MPNTLKYYSQKYMQFLYIVNYHSKVWGQYICFKEIDIFIQRGRIQLVKSNNKYIYNVIIDFCFM